MQTANETNDRRPNVVIAAQADNTQLLVKQVTRPALEPPQRPQVMVSCQPLNSMITKMKFCLQNGRSRLYASKQIIPCRIIPSNTHCFHPIKHLFLIRLLALDSPLKETLLLSERGRHIRKRTKDQRRMSERCPMRLRRTFLRNSPLNQLIELDTTVTFVTFFSSRRR